MDSAWVLFFYYFIPKTLLIAREKIGTGGAAGISLFHPVLCPDLSHPSPNAVSFLREKDRYGYGSCFSPLWTLKLRGFRLGKQLRGQRVEIPPPDCFPNQIMVYP